MLWIIIILLAIIAGTLLIGAHDMKLLLGVGLAVSLGAALGAGVGASIGDDMGISWMIGAFGACGALAIFALLHRPKRPPAD